MRWISNNPNWETEFISDCIKEYNKKYKTNFKGYQDFKDLVSVYGASKECELFAEAFAEFYGGKNPRDFAVIFGNKLNNILKELI